MSANVATNFPPQTYSSQFFLNTLCDEVSPSATPSKKRPKTPPDGAESSNTVLDCFISTISTMLKSWFLAITLALFLQFSQIGAQMKYPCMDSAHPSIRSFENILEFQRNTIKFGPRNNHVSFNTVTISHLQSNDFVGYDSNMIRKLILNDKRIELIDSGSFNELYCVKYLLLQDNLIGGINNGTFSGLYSLQELNLSNNDISEIPSGSFWNLRHLLRLDLSKNKIRNLYDDSFQYLRSLWELNLSNNEISNLPNNLFVFSTHLHSLHLGFNKIVVPSAIEYSNLDNLDYLGLQNNQIQTFGYQAFKELSKLTELNICSNQITFLNISELPKTLERINFAHNSFQCTHLKTLLSELSDRHVGIIINDNTKHNQINIEEIGCINGSSPITPKPTTTTQQPWFTKPTRSATTHNTNIIIPTQPATILTPVAMPDSDQIWKIEQENRSLFKAVSDLTTVIVILIIIIVMFNVIDILIRTNSFERCRRRFVREPRPFLQFRGLGSGYSDTSYPLLQR